MTTLKLESSVKITSLRFSPFCRYLHDYKFISVHSSSHHFSSSIRIFDSSNSRTLKITFFKSPISTFTHPLWGYKPHHLPSWPRPLSTGRVVIANIELEIRISALWKILFLREQNDTHKNKPLFYKKKVTAFFAHLFWRLSKIYPLVTKLIT